MHPDQLSCEELDAWLDWTGAEFSLGRLRSFRSSLRTRIVSSLLLWCEYDYGKLSEGKPATASASRAYQLHSMLHTVRSAPRHSIAAAAHLAKLIR